MKLLKNDSTIFVEQIMKKINSCYTDSNPSNAQLMELYSLIGKNICEQGEKAFVVYLAEILSEQLPHLKGFSPRNLRRMRDFYVTYQSEPKLMKKAQTLSWTQNTVILECCENNEQRSFYLALSEKNNKSKLALMKAIKEESFENTSTEEIALEAENDRCPFVSDLCDTEDSNTSSPVKNDCSAVGPRYKPFRQGIGIGKIGDKALKYICRLKIDLWYLKVLYYKKSSLSIRSLIERPWQKLKYYSPPPDITGQNQIPLLLLTYGIVTDRKSIVANLALDA